MKIGPQPEKWLRKKAKQGMRGYHVGTIAFYALLSSAFIARAIVL